jgi:uncharacterized linocin/CFP29 family protein
MSELTLATNMAGASYETLLANNSDPGVLRPFVGPDGRNYVTRKVRNAAGAWEHRTFTTNAATTLPYDTWKLFDDLFIQVQREQLKAVADLRRRGLVMPLPNGMAHTVLQYQILSDITDATVSMKPTRRSEVDRPDFDTATLPLPLVHKDFDYDARDLMASRLGNQALDTTTGMLAMRKVAELLEKMLIGTVTPFKHGGGTVYGYLTLPERAIATIVVPDGTNGNAVVNSLLGLRQLLIDDNHMGPYVLYLNRQWSEFLDSDFSTAKGDLTLRQRITAVEDIEDVTVLDYLPTTDWHALLVEMKAENARLIVGMEPTIVQWESLAGYMRHFKCIAEIVPHVRADAHGNSGIAHGTD